MTCPQYLAPLCVVQATLTTTNAVAERQADKRQAPVALCAQEILASPLRDADPSTPTAIPDCAVLGRNARHERPHPAIVLPAARPYQKRTKSRQKYRFCRLLTLINVFRINGRWGDGYCVQLSYAPILCFQALAFYSLASPGSKWLQ
jgi:hypothetical protein